MKKNYLLICFVVFSMLTCLAQDTTWVTNVTSLARLDSVSAFRIYAADVNNDNYPDIIVIHGGASDRYPINLYLNLPSPDKSGGRVFINATSTSGLNEPSDNATLPGREASAVALADVNNDGNIDVVTGSYYHRIEKYTNYGNRMEVFLGDGAAHFTMVPDNGLDTLGFMYEGFPGDSLLPPQPPSFVTLNLTGFSFLDYDKDGNIDLAVATWFRDYTNDTLEQITDTVVHVYLMKGNGDGTFTDVSKSSDISSELEPLYGISTTDWNNDGWVDILTSPYCRDGGKLWKNNGDGTFTNVAADVNYNSQFLGGDNGQPLCTWGTMVDDFDNNGVMDLLFVLVHGGNDSLEGHSTIVMNEGPDSSYHLHWDLDRMTWNAPKASHHGDYDASFFDMDKDGLDDIVMTQGSYDASARMYFFRQDSSNHFNDIKSELGLIAYEQESTHQNEPIDYDMDGDDDILYSSLHSENPLYLIQNNADNVFPDRNYISVKLNNHPGVNGSAIGSRIKVYSGSLIKTREIWAGRGNQGGQQPFILNFSIDTNTTVDSVVVQWPNMYENTVVTNPLVNQLLVVSPLTTYVNNTISSNQSFQLYPNPVADNLFISIPSSLRTIRSVEIYSITGKLLKTTEPSRIVSSVISISTDELPAGYYLVRLINDRSEGFVKPFIKNY